jgi:hypothetical protein
MNSDDLALLEAYKNIGTVSQFQQTLKVLEDITHLLESLDIRPLPLLNDFNYYLKNQDELVSQYDGRVIVIKDHKVLGNYHDDYEAVTATMESGHELGTFLVQKVSPGDQDYKVILSRAVVR